MIIINIFCIFILIIGIVCLYKSKKIQVAKKDTTIQLQQLEQKLEQSIQEKQTMQDKLDQSINDKIQKEIGLTQEITNKQHQIQEYYNKGKENADEQLKIYQINLDAQKEKEYQSYQEEKQNLLDDLSTIQEELSRLKNTRKATQEAFLKEEQIKQEKNNYCLIPSEDDLIDISILEEIKPKLKKPRVLCMLIWQTFWQPLAKKQFPKILGTTSVVTGIYKITNQKTGLCYIGQSGNIDTRWKEHLKCGLGIDTPPGNKLYIAMQKDGIQNFSFEVLETCTKEELNSKEQFYIDLYSADKIGYNGNAGINK